ncbi:MAG: STAS domain-containing protein [Isosphaeraceae bacterium]
MLTYSAHEANGVLVFTVEEATGDQVYTSQREWLYKTIESREDPRFVIDLAAVNYMASTDVGVLVTIKRRIDQRKGKLALVHVDPFIYDILRTMRIDKLIPIHEDLPSALAAVAQV